MNQALKLDTVCIHSTVSLLSLCPINNVSVLLSSVNDLRFTFSPEAYNNEFIICYACVCWAYFFLENNYYSRHRAAAWIYDWRFELHKNLRHAEVKQSEDKHLEKESVSSPHRSFLPIHLLHSVSDLLDQFVSAVFMLKRVHLKCISGSTEGDARIKSPKSHFGRILYKY